MGVLESIDEWPCDHAAAALIRPDGTIDTHGPTNRPFELASVTKLLTATTLLIAVEECSLELDVPETDDGATLADLLAHSSGIAPDGHRLDDPGRRRVYSNAGYEQAARALETATDMTFATYLSEAVTQPLGMSDSALTASPAFGAHSTVDDLTRFLLGIPSLLASETIERMVSPYLPELIGVLPGYGRQVPNPWGLGPELRGDKAPHWTGSSNSTETWGHFGQAGTFLWVDPERQASVIVLTDLAFGDWARDRWPVLADRVLDDLD